MNTQNEARDMRYELKLECESAYFSEAQAWIRLHSAGFRQAYPLRQVNSLYLDTLSLDAFNDHIESVPARRKLRFRWYGPDLDTARGQLELKSKTERAGWKVVQPVSRAVDLRGCDWATIWQEMLASLQDGAGTPGSNLFKELLQVSRPWVINCYQRFYYVSADGRIRLTLDYDIRAFDQWMTPRPNLDFRLPMPDIILLELKGPVEHSRHLADVVAEFPLRVHRYSKYVTALSSLLER